jgi:hypothetical protein
LVKPKNDNPSLPFLNRVGVLPKHGEGGK